MLLLMAIHSTAICKEITLQDSIILKNELRIGDQAPELKVTWIKGKPVQKMEKGMVYVLEFWATWCVPCIAAMPHISELSKKYDGKATFIGVDIFERGKPGQNTKTYVSNFVKDMGEKMDYNICMENSDAYMAKNWVEAAGQSTIPTTIIVDKEGKIAWIGLPNGLEEPLKKIIENTFDSKAYANQIKVRQEQAFLQKRQQEKIALSIKPIEDAITKKDYKLALSEYQVITTRDPSLKGYLMPSYYKALIRYDPDQAYQKAMSVKDSIYASAVVARTFADEEKLSSRFYQYSIGVFEKQPNNPGVWEPLAKAYFADNKFAKAVEVQQKFVDWLNAAKNPAPAEYVEKQLALLEKYKKAL